MVGVAQLAERRIVAPKVEGSSPFSHPICAVSSAGQSRGLLIPRSRVRIPDGAPCELRNARKAQASGRFLLRVAARLLLVKAPTCMGAVCAGRVALCTRERGGTTPTRQADVVHATRDGTVPMGRRTRRAWPWTCGRACLKISLRPYGGRGRRTVSQRSCAITPKGIPA